MIVSVPVVVVTRVTSGATAKSMYCNRYVRNVKGMRNISPLNLRKFITYTNCRSIPDLTCDVRPIVKTCPVTSVNPTSANSNLGYDTAHLFAVSRPTHEFPPRQIGSFDKA
ncbi:hypothetical protein BDZ94DRAFT_1261771 [Collybia nuda]|uniref:Uncharacterized protein n=1 Tax=Collybia nuda TaxID=64659 RepID=A0A9P5Y3W5_9AGAR|nr:hypothetical protein BDZ94DRAFT_1261771 [Collybia nuda]